MRTSIALAVAVPLALGAMTVTALQSQDQPAPRRVMPGDADRNRDGAPDDMFTGVYCHEEFDSGEGLRNCWANGGW